MKGSTLVFLLLISIAAAIVSAGDYQKTRNLRLPAAGIETLRIESGAGFLHIRGSNAIDEIQVQAEIVFHNGRRDDMEEFIRKNVHLELETEGNQALLVSEVKSRVGFWSGMNAAINLTVKVPSRIKLDIDDGSGSIEISDMASRVKIVDGSGSIRLEDVDGSVYIDDGSGSITLRKISGNVEIEDGSGSITCSDIGGDLFLDDGSGSMTIKHVQGSVVVKDGSGSINIADVGKDVMIKEAGSGGVNISGVKGQVVRRDD